MRYNLLDRKQDALNKKYPVPRQYVNESSNDKRTFNDRYITAVRRRMKALRVYRPIPTKVARLNIWKKFCVTAEAPQFTKPRR